MNDNIKKVIPILSKFTAQTVTGVQISAFTQLAISYDKYTDVKELLLVTYLNDCWQSLILKKDKYVVKTFYKIHKYLPDVSPLCMFHIIKEMASQCLQKKLEIGFSIPPKNRIPTNEAFVNTLRNILGQIYENISGDMIKSYLDKHTHECTNAKIGAIHDLESTPIWVINKMK